MQRVSGSWNTTPAERPISISVTVLGGTNSEKPWTGAVMRKKSGGPNLVIDQTGSHVPTIRPSTRGPLVRPRNLEETICSMTNARAATAIARQLRLRTWAYYHHTALSIGR